MEPRLRKTRTLKVTEVRVPPEELIELASFYKSSHWEAALNLMERACISIETCLINAPLGNPEEILGAHAVTKAAWLFFNYVQEQVYAAYITQMQEPKDQEAPTLSDMIQSVEGMPMHDDAGIAEDFNRGA